MGVPQPRRVVAGAHLPALLAGLRVERHQGRVGRAPVDRVAVDRHAAVPVHRLRLVDVLRVAAGVDPGHVAGDDVERGHAAAAFRHVHQAVGHDRRRDPAAPVPHRVRPDELQVADVLPVDLVEGAEPGDVVGPPEAHPVAVLRGEQALLGDGLPRRLVRLRECGAPPGAAQGRPGPPARIARRHTLASSSPFGDRTPRRARAGASRPAGRRRPRAATAARVA